MLSKKVFNTVRTDKSTLLIKRNCQRAVSGPYLQNRILLPVFLNQKIHHHLPVTIPLPTGFCGNLSAMFDLGNIADAQSLFWLRNYGILFMILILGATEIPRKLTACLFQVNKHLANILEPAFLILIFALSMIYLSETAYNPFLYFRF